MTELGYAFLLLFSTMADPNDLVADGQSDCSTMAAAHHVAGRADTFSMLDVRHDVNAGGRTNSSSRRRWDAKTLRTAPFRCIR